MEARLGAEANFEQLHVAAPLLHPVRVLVKGVSCSVRIEEIDDPLLLDLRRLCKLVDAWAKGDAMKPTPPRSPAA